MAWTNLLPRPRGLLRGFSAALLALAVPLPILAAATPSFSAGAASADITPDPAAINWVTNRPYEGIVDRIHARVLVLASDDTRVALLTLDMTDANETDVATLRAAISAAIGVPPAHILINASHSHSAPIAPGYTRKQISDPHLARWTRQLPERCAEAARAAESGRRPVSLSIGRAQVGEWIFNRRPVRPDGTVKTTFTPADRNVLPEGLRFAPIDPTATVLAFRDQAGAPVATLLHLACHAVSVYGAHKGVSADWPGAACLNLQRSQGGEVLFLQGCGGDIVPARRGLEEARTMGAFIAERAAAAAAQSLALKPAPLAVSQSRLGLPLTDAVARETGRLTVNAEIQVITCGDLALVALPGEPLIGLSMAIQEGSPYPHTIVLGYSNGDGVEYVGLPGEKIRGGYEMSAEGRGADECGGLMVASALRLLREHHQARRR